MISILVGVKAIDMFAEQLIMSRTFVLPDFRI